MTAPTPADFELPHDSFRPGQLEAILVAQSVQPGGAIAIELPTGGGKSAIAAAVGHGRPTTYLADKIMLLAQIAERYDYQAVYGRDRYECAYLIDHYNYSAPIPLTSDMCVFSPMKDCPLIDACTYFWAREAARDSQKRALSYAYYYAARWAKESPGMLFCDEAHIMPDRMLDLVGLEMNLKQRERWHLPPFPDANGAESWARDRISTWATEAHDSMPSRSTVKQDKLAAYDRLRAKLNSMPDLLSQGDWYVRSGLDGLFAKPLTPAPFTGFLRDTQGTILMSATIGDASVLGDELGLPHLAKLEFEHPISAGQRPIWYITNSPAMSSKATSADFDYQAGIIAKVLAMFPAYRGIIHVSRWSETIALMERLIKFGVPRSRLWAPTQGAPTDEQVAAFVSNPSPDVVAIAPNWREGLDLKDDLARLSIIAKVPFLLWGDPFIQARATRPGIGKRWYDNDACTAVVQAAGRVVRNETDFGITVIVDRSWNRVKRYAPRWFSPTPLAIEP